MTQRSSSYAWYVVGVLMLVYTVAVIDRAVLTILQIPIQADLGLSDSQLGLLTGPAFALFYGFLAIPVARIADKRNRTMLISFSLLLWSLMTAGSGLAAGFIALLVFRMGVGVGEAGCYPPAASVISDYFHKARRASAFAVFALGVPLGQTLGLFAAGMLEEAFGWRYTFLLVGGFGVLLAPLVLLTVREPKRGQADDDPATDAPSVSPSLRQVFVLLWRVRALRYLYLANMCHGFVVTAYMSWTPPLYTRSYGLSTGDAAHWLGLLSIAGAVGTYVGAAIAERLGARDGRWYLWVVAIAGVVVVPASVLQVWSGSVWLSLIAGVIPSALLMFFVGPAIAVVQTLVQPNMRSTAAAFMPLLYNIVGAGLGPLVVGVLSDAFKGPFGDDALRYALPIALSVEWLAAAFFFLAGRDYVRALHRDRQADFQ